MEMFSQFNCMQNPKSRLSNNKGRARTVVLLFAQQTRGHVWPLNLFCLLEPQYRYAEKQITDIIGLTVIEKSCVIEQNQFSSKVLRCDLKRLVAILLSIKLRLLC